MKEMKKIVGIVMALGITLGAQAAITADDVIKIDFGAAWSIAGQTDQETRFQDTVGFVNFTAVSTDGSGNISLTMNDISDGGPPAMGRNVGISELTLTIVGEVSGATLAVAPTWLSMDLVAPDTSTNGVISTTYVAGIITSNDITIVSALADAGFTAAMTNSMGLANPNEDITVTFDNSDIGLANGESTNSTLTVTWTEAGSGLTNTASAALDVFYVSSNLSSGVLAVYDFNNLGDGAIEGVLAADLATSAKFAATAEDTNVTASNIGVGPGLISATDLIPPPPASGTTA